MSRILENITSRFVQRKTSDNLPVTDIFHEWDEDGEHRYAMSRVKWTITDSSYARAAANEAFKRRQLA